MASTLLDNRRCQAMTPEEGDALLMNLGRLKAIMDRAQADWKKRMAELALRQKAELDPLIAEFKAAEAELSAYVAANPGRFVKPRFRKVPQVGEYGIRTDPAYVKIEDRDGVVEYAMSHGLSEDLLAMKPSPDKEKIAAAIADGKTVPYARVIPAGDSAKYKFLPSYLEQALKG